MELNIEHALEQFRKAFPLINVEVYENEMRYRMPSKALAESCEVRALVLIIQAHLPLVTSIEEWWSSRRGTFEINLVVKYAPEMESIPCY